MKPKSEGTGHGEEKAVSPGDIYEGVFSEAKCREYLAYLRWPDGFVCPKCGCRHSCLLTNGRYQCAECHHQICKYTQRIPKCLKWEKYEGFNSAGRSHSTDGSAPKLIDEALDNKHTQRGEIIVMDIALAMPVRSVDEQPISYSIEMVRV